MISSLITVMMDHVEKIPNNAQVNLDVLQCLDYAQILLAFKVIKSVLNFQCVLLINFTNVKIKLVYLILKTALLELPVIILVMLYAQIKHVFQMKYSVKFQLLVMII
mmetsp:Transcript_78840/g.118511  ORF Transcript_78840/g.118511 Transcript_78840/m.118511 type:complete len:107 (+) Transcript_78840:195-515(+)